MQPSPPTSPSSPRRRPLTPAQPPGRRSTGPRPPLDEVTGHRRNDAFGLRKGVLKRLVPAACWSSPRRGSPNSRTDVRGSRRQTSVSRARARPSPALAMADSRTAPPIVNTRHPKAGRPTVARRDLAEPRSAHATADSGDTPGAGFQASDDSPHAVECELVEDGGAFVAHPGDRRRRGDAAGSSSARWKLARLGPVDRPRGGAGQPFVVGPSVATEAAALGNDTRPPWCSGTPGVRPGRVVGSGGRASVFLLFTTTR